MKSPCLERKYNTRKYQEKADRNSKESNQKSRVQDKREESEKILRRDKIERDRQGQGQTSTRLKRCVAWPDAFFSDS